MRSSTAQSNTPPDPKGNLSWPQFCGLVVICALPMVVVWLGFSAAAFGDVLHRVFVAHEGISEVFFGVSLLTGILLYLLDASFWTSTPLIVIKSIAAAFVLIGLMIGFSLTVTNYPYAPLGAFCASIPFYFMAIRKRFFAQVGDEQWFMSQGRAEFISCFVGFFAWIIWTLNGHWWNEDVNREYSLRLNCKVEVHCLAAYVAWAAPAIYAGFSAVLAGISIYLSISLRNARRRAEQNEQVKGISIALRAFFVIVCLGMLGLWVAAELAGIELQLSHLITTFSSLTIIIACLAVLVIIGWKEIKRQLETIPFLAKLLESLFSDWMRAFFVICSGPFVAAALGISWLNQRIRICFGRKLYVKNQSGIVVSKTMFTAKVQAYFDEAKTWRWTSVLTKITWIGIIVITLNVGIGIATTVFLSWLIQALASTSLAFTTFIFVIVGVLMFLAPPIPGVPVYISAGIMLVANAQKSWGFLLACAYGILAAFFLKLFSFVLQNKMLGEGLGSWVSVRRMVDVNSISIRAIRRILIQPGMKFDKVCILCGGPDWPTSVLTGILHLNLFQMLYGTLPLVVLIAPCVFAGALLLKVNEGPIYSALGSVTLALATVVQIMAMVAAGYYIEDYAYKHREELEKEEPDTEVLEFDEKEKVKEELFNELTDWNSNLPVWQKINISISAILMISTLYILEFAEDLCFKPYQLTDTIQETLGGNVWNIVLRTGWIAIILFCISTFQIYVFKYWAQAKVNREYLRRHGDCKKQPQEQDATAEQTSKPHADLVS